MKAILVFKHFLSIIINEMEEKSIIKLICESRTLCPCYDSDGIVKIYNNYMKLQKTVLILLILQAVVSADECVAD